MKKKTKRFVDPEEIIDAGETEYGSEKRSFIVRAINWLGFEVDFSDLKNRDFSPRNGWAKMKNAAANGLTVFNSKQAAFDKPLFILVIILLTLGTAMMASASYAYAYSNHQGNSLYYINKQIIFAVIGIILMLVISTIPPEKLKGVNSYVFWVISVALLILVRLLPAMKGVHRWINLGFTTFQPSELAKFAVILVCSTYISYHFKEMNITTL